MNVREQLENDLSVACSELTEKKQELIDLRGNRPDPSDTASCYELMAQTNATIERLSEDIRKINRLLLMSDTELAECEECGCSLPQERVAALHTTICVDCKSIKESRNHSYATG